MLDLLNQIDRRAKYLDAMLPKTLNQTEPTIPVELPDEAWAKQFQGLSVSALAMPRLSKTYGAEARERSESPVVTMFRHAAKGETPRLDAEIELELARLPDGGKAKIEQFCADWKLN